MKQGLLVSIYRNAELDDATNGGISARVSKGVLVGPEVRGPFEPSDEAPAFRLMKRVLSRGELYYYAIPIETPRGRPVGPMFGGNFLYTSDSRFRRVCDYPIPIHDRWETAEDYEALSR